MKNPIAFLTHLISTGCTVIGIRTSQEPQYQVIEETGEIQIRLYPPLLVAETWVSADYSEAGRIGFNRLAGYIFGDNRQKQSMPMTTPVFRELHGETLDMTMPVIQQTEGAQWGMAFVMPPDRDLDSLPTPIDNNITLKTLPAKKVAVLRYSGSLTVERIIEKSQVLIDWLSQHHWQPCSSPRSAAYDPPWTIPALRRNEIHIDIEQEQP